ncbi:zinc metallopeptidase [Ruminiclostridium cellulolyticum]|uniref:Peptidase membrane zinc metallopeptidase putative n=1 Tax=Ruminiclostridium cellulolyticum (strain ATCC 35319 / DSM 5812 / JCM 6584 / H10) TaxID=394503 RepID=B8I257_RUMCH|nr:zinc metallopeptidase [Ruminiclostridium cellulolyticum]ACL75883.1 peptidase membrane zinc metallopeptidase putative [Ruminiclostridium cellulolyticum H10]
MGFFYMDRYYLILVVPALIISMIAQIKVKSTFNKYSKVGNSKHMTGAEVARYLLQVNGIQDVQVTQVGGQLTDHYDPRKKVLRLSESTYASTSVAAIGVAAHETGHAIQHKVKYGPLVLRSTLVPVAGFGSAAGPYIAILGLFLGWPVIINVGLVLFFAAILFYLITLPVEFNASKRAISVLGSTGILMREELISAKKVLNAAAMTYVASALVAIASFLRLLLLANSRRNRD